MPKKKPEIIEQETTSLSIDVILEACNNDPETVEFFGEWLTNGKNAGDAYKKLHPDVTDGSAATLGWRMLKKVDKGLVMQAYGLTTDLYMRQLYEGAQATKWNDFTGDREADHNTRKYYHGKLGEHLELETKEEVKPGGNTFYIQNNYAHDPKEYEEFIKFRDNKRRKELEK